MAQAVFHKTIVNPARRANKKRRHLSAKQIRAGFGGKRRKIAARHHNKPKANRKHNKPKVNRHHHHNTPKAANRAPQRNRSNPAPEILSMTLGNPAGKRNRMAAKAKQNRHHHHKNKKTNPAKMNRRHNASASYSKRPLFMNKHHKKHNKRHHNPGGESMTALLFDGVFVIGGMVSTRLLTQLVLGTNNTGVWGYAGNAAATAAVAMGAHMLKAGPRVVNALVIGGAAAIVARIISDYTPFGTYLQQAGFGDYAGGGGHGVGLYLPSNAVMPQRYVNAANSALVQIPQGWAPTTVVQAAPAAAAGVSGLYGRSRTRRLY